MRWYGYLFTGILGLGGFTLAAGAGVHSGTNSERGAVRRIDRATAPEETPLRTSDGLRNADALSSSAIAVRLRNGGIGSVARPNGVPCSRLAAQAEGLSGAPRMQAAQDEAPLCRDASLQSQSVRLQI